MTDSRPSDDDLRRILTSARTIAIVGASGDSERPSHEVMKFLMSIGYNVIPVNPREREVLGKPAFRSLSDVTEPIDIVDVFRRVEELPPIAEEAVSVGAKVLWMQLGIENEVAASRARAGGMEVVQNTCIAAAANRLGVRANPG